MKIFCLLSIILILAVANQAHAYIDPGSGSYMLQILLAFIFGALASIKMFWLNIKEFFRNLFSKSKNNGN